MAARIQIGIAMPQHIVGTRLARTLTYMMLALGVGACTHLQSYRNDYKTCASSDLEHDCRASAVQQLVPQGKTSPAYMLGIVEFDDQGQFFDREQMRVVLSAAQQETLGADRDSITVVFVHGWKHNAWGGDETHAGDDNLSAFRLTLLHLSETETRLSALQQRSARKIIGIYLAWRGLSVSAPVARELTFWDRKNTAHFVGHGGVTEVLFRLEDMRRTRDAVVGGHSDSRLVVVGHSFGGAVVFSALAQTLDANFVSTVGPPGTNSDVEGFGSLVVLLNPAFEALLYSPLGDMSNERRTYFDTQLPVLAVLTSEADWATKKAFKAGRWLGTRFEKTRKTQRDNPVNHQVETIDESDTNITAIGHYVPYRTHILQATDTASQPTPLPTSAESVENLKRVSKAWQNDAPGGEIPFAGSTLKRTEDTVARNPYLVVQVDKALIKDHNAIWDPRVTEFITQLILLTSQSKDPAARESDRNKL